MDKIPRIAIIGCGPTAMAHALALKNIGIKILHCAAQSNTNDLQSFAKNLDIEFIWNSATDLINAHSKWDGLIIASSVDSLPGLLEQAIQYEKPILIEKPVSIGTDYLIKFKYKSPENIMVGYNRRFYNTVDFTKNFLNKKHKKNFCSVQLPETINFSNDINLMHRPIYYNSCHGIDLLRYLLGDLKIKHVNAVNSDNLEIGRYAILESCNKDICFLSLNWNSPANFSLMIENGEDKVSLNPFESFQKFSGMVISEPTIQYPIRKYTPKEVECFDVFNNENKEVKPGFYGQIIEFIDLINGKPLKKAARLSDAYHAQFIIEKLLNYTIY